LHVRCRHGDVRRECVGLRGVPRLRLTRRSCCRLADRADNEASSRASCGCDLGDDRVVGRAAARDPPDLCHCWRGRLILTPSGEQRRVGAANRDPAPKPPEFHIKPLGVGAVSGEVHDALRPHLRGSVRRGRLPGCARTRRGGWDATREWAQRRHLCPNRRESLGNAPNFRAVVAVPYVR
jgi:hypothetical protein